MQGVLYVSHGTRLSKGKQDAIDFLKSIENHVKAPLQEICFLEICSPTIEEGINQLVERGATAISVVPVLLLSAKHDQEDIPFELNKVQRKYPSITFSYGRPLGVQDRLVDILVERVQQPLKNSDPEANILLVGRGSFVSTVQSDITTIAEKLSHRVNRNVDVSYLAACKPSFDDALSQLSNNKQKSVVVVPYLWFDGLLVQSMKKKIEWYNQVNDAQLQLSHHLADHENIKQALVDRANQSLDLKMDGVMGY